MLENKGLSEKIIEASRIQLKKRFEGFANSESVDVLPIDLEQAAVNINHRSEIFLYGVDITIRLQVFYNLEESVRFLKSAISKSDPEKCIDFYNELCNLVCGKLKEQFIKQKILVAISLPIDIETSQKKLVMSKEVLPFTQCFELCNSEGIRIFSSKLSLQIHELDNFKKYEDSLVELIEEGEVEFL